MSMHCDVADTDDQCKKEPTPKGIRTVADMPGHAVKSCMTVIVGWGAIKAYLINDDFLSRLVLR